MVRNRPTLLFYSEEGLHLPFLLLYNNIDRRLWTKRKAGPL